MRRVLPKVLFLLLPLLTALASASQKCAKELREEDALVELHWALGMSLSGKTAVMLLAVKDDRFPGVMEKARASGVSTWELHFPAGFAGDVVTWIKTMLPDRQPSDVLLLTGLESAAIGAGLVHGSTPYRPSLEQLNLGRGRLREELAVRAVILCTPDSQSPVLLRHLGDVLDGAQRFFID